MNNLSDEQIKSVWDSIDPQGDPSGMKFAIAFARAILALSAQQAGTVEPFGYWHEGPTEDESEFYLAKDVPDSDQSCDRCKPLYLAAAPDSQGAPKQHFCEKPVGYRAVWKADGYVWHSSRIVKTAKDAESITKQWVAQEMPGCFEFEAQALYTHPSDGAQAAGQEDK